MQYISTRGNSGAEFSDIILSSTAPDGGLFLPEYYPDLAGELDELAGLSYTNLAYRIISLFTDDETDKSTLKKLIEHSYSGFTHDEIAPLKDLEDFSVLELFHGPTYAFKDFALQFLGNLFEHLLNKRDTYLNLVGATSGDTGSAAIYGLMGKPRMNIFMLHPHQGISLIQKIQMTSVKEHNVFNIAVEGTFDDGQRIIKDIFADLTFCREHHIGSVNSINWGRILAQVVYYFYAGLKFRKKYPNRPLVFCVPTGNFGNIFAGYVAVKMGLPVSRFICATNVNDIVARTIETGVYQVGTVHKTLSPSMDIQVPSNLERLLFELSGRDADYISSVYEMLKKNQSITLRADIFDRLKAVFSGGTATDEETLAAIRRIYKNDEYVLDPHTAVGVHAAQKLTKEHFIVLGTAHYGKFIDIYSRLPEVRTRLPEELKALYKADCFYRKLPADKEKIKQYIVHSLVN